MGSMRRRAVLALMGSIAGACLGLAAFACLRACSRVIADGGASDAAPFDSLRARVADFNRRSAR